MATVAAGLTMGSWGRAKISSSVTEYIEHFWEYMAFLANALIFLFVGLRVNLGALYGSLDILAWVIVAMLVLLGRYCRINPLRFSLLPRSQEWYGVAK